MDRIRSRLLRRRGRFNDHIDDRCRSREPFDQFCDVALGERGLENVDQPTLERCLQQTVGDDICSKRHLEAGNQFE